MQGAGGVGGLLAVQREGTWYAPLYDADGHQKSAKPKAVPPGDRDFIAAPQGRSEERYPATQRHLYVSAYVSETGEVVAEYECDAFGATITQLGSQAEALRGQSTQRKCRKQRLFDPLAHTLRQKTDSPKR